MRGLKNSETAMKLKQNNDKPYDSLNFKTYGLDDRWCFGIKKKN